MQLAQLRSYAAFGIEARAVDIEVHLSGGLPGLTIVGLAETEVRESRDRVRSAILNSGFEFPARRITVNLAPADLPKHGGRFDLPIALGILLASGQIQNAPPESAVLVGELALSGELRRITNALAVAAECSAGGQVLFCPEQNAAELAPFFRDGILLIGHLLDLARHLQQEETLPSPDPSAIKTASAEASNLSAVTGQHQAKRALEIAAAGGHNLLLYGPPGSGKSMLAACMPGILPPLTQSERLTSAIIHAAHGGVRHSDLPPFRTPHHTSSAVALVGGGNHPRPGEVSLAHGGVLFLDEFAEFAPKALQALREPLENGEITLSRANYKCCLPARFQLLAAMNPCPCGYLGTERCRCAPGAVRRYLARVSGPLMDRIDLHLHVQQPAHSKLLQSSKSESSEAVSKRVAEARLRAEHRQGCPNAGLAAPKLDQYLEMTDEARQLVTEAAERLQLSARALHRLLRVARTIADLDHSTSLEAGHLGEATTLRNPDIYPAGE